MITGLGFDGFLGGAGDAAELVCPADVVAPAASSVDAGPRARVLTLDSAETVVSTDSSLSSSELSLSVLVTSESDDRLSDRGGMPRESLDATLAFDSYVTFAKRGCVW